jgi:DNA polymerase III subunit delta'
LVAADHSTEADWIEGLPLPREQTALVGHADAARELHEAYRSGRMHHAFLITGPKGIGKATLAFRFARFALSHPDPAAAPPPDGEPLSPVDPRVAGQVAAGAHPNVLHLKRPWDEKDKKLKTVLTVDEVRRAVPFFGSAAGGRGYRIAIVDAADDMNPAAANALLKMLEEPPSRAVFLVLSHAPGGLLPTIRSRCRRFPLDPLDADQIDAAVTELGLAVEEGDKPALAAVAEGSVRRACELIETEGLDLYRDFREIVDRLPALDRRALHKFADRAGGGRRGEATLGFIADLARTYLSERIHGTSGETLERLAKCAAAWEAIGQVVAETDALNLDRKQAAMTIMQSLAESARN